MEQTTLIVETRKSDLRDKRPGTVNYSEPKFIWVKMLHRPHRKRLLQLRKKFNEIFEETLAGHKYCYILDPDIVLKTDHFDRANCLTSEGKIAFWRFLDEQLKKFDRQEIYTQARENHH